MIPGPHALQSDMLPLDHCDLHVVVVNTMICDDVTHRAAVDGEQQRPQDGPVHKRRPRASRLVTDADAA